MAVSNLVFPSTLAGFDIAITRAAIDSVRVDESQLSNVERRSTWSTFPRYRYNVAFNILRADSIMAAAARNREWQKLFGFVQRHATRLDSFLFVDPDDNQVASHFFGKGDGSTLSFQLQRTLVDDSDLAAAGSRTYWPGFSDGYEPIVELNGTPAIYKDTGAGPVLQTLTTQYTLPGSGAVQFVAAPAAGALLSWSCSYYRRVRFDMDAVSATRVAQSMWEAKSIQLISVK